MTWRDGTTALRSGRQMEDQAYIIPFATSIPTLPDPLYPIGCVFRRTTDQSFWVNSAGSWVPVNALNMGTDRGLVQANTLYNVGDIVTLAYGGSSAGYARVLITTAATSGGTRFISAANYKRLTPRMPGLNVQEFGAQGNGITDDTAAIQAAIDWADAGTGSTTGQGISIYFPGGYYIISSTIVLKKHVWLIGEGQRSSVLKLATNANCNVIKTFDTGGASGNADYTGIINMVIDGNMANQNGAGPYHGVVYNTNPTGGTAAGDSFFDMHHVMQNCTVYKCKGNGIDMTGRSAIQIHNVHIQSCLVYGIKSTFDLTLIGVEADSCGSSGFNLNNGSVKAIACKSYLSGFNTPTTDAAGFKIGNVGPCELVGCEAQNNKLQGYNLVSADRIHLSGCNADGNNTTNSVTDSDRVAVSMVGSTNCIIDVVSNEMPQGGSQIGHQSYALHIDSTSSNNDIRMVHSALAPATVLGEITPTSAPQTGVNTVLINGVNATAMVFGPNNGVITGANADTNLYRASADKLATDDDFLINLAGKGLRVKEGTNAKMGIATLSAGTVVVSTTAVTANSRIFLDNQTLGGTAGFLRVSARSAGTSFTILSSSNTDTSVIAWMLVEPA